MITPSVLDGEVPNVAKPRPHVTLIGDGVTNDQKIIIIEDEHVAVVVTHEVAILIVHNVAAQMCW